MVATNISYGFTEIATTFTNTNIFDISWIVAILIIMLSLLLITRDYNEWKTLAFPIAVLWIIVGLNVPIVILIGLGILFVIENLSMKLLGYVIDTASAVAKPTVSRILVGREGVEKARRQQVSERMENIERGVKLREFKRKLRQTQSGYTPKGVPLTEEQLIHRTIQVRQLRKDVEAGLRGALDIEEQRKKKRKLEELRKRLKR